MIAYPIEAIHIAPDRQRQEFEAQAMEELRASIDGKQLQHAPVVRMEQGRPVLVAGERRLRAISDIFALGGFFYFDGVKYTDSVPTVTLGELDPLQAEEAELDENLRRKDLTWQELAAAHKRLHELRVKQAAQKNELGQLAEGVSGSEFVPVTHTVADTTRELNPHLKDVPTGQLGSAADRVRKELLVAKHLDKPEIAKAKNVDEAFKILKRSEEAERNRELALEVGKSFSADSHLALNMNCLAWMRQHLELQRPGFDVILTDPPYGMNAQAFGDGGGKLSGIEHRYNDTPEEWRALMQDWCGLAYKIAKPQAHAYVFCDLDRFHELRQMMLDAGWKVHRTPLIDYKTDSGRVPWPECGPRRQWEMILYAVKGDKPVTNIYPDVIPCQADANMTHGAQKPVALYANLLKRSVKPGDSVLDTFAGSGTIFPACHQFQCIATGIEQNPEYFGMCLRRLKDLREAIDPLSALMAEVGEAPL